MSQRKRGHDEDDAQQRAVESWNRGAAARGTLEDGGNQEHDQEQDVVVSGPDVPDPLLQRLEKAATRGSRSCKGPRPAASCQQGSLFTLAGPYHRQIERQRAADLEGFDAVGGVLSAQLREQKRFAAQGAVGQLCEVPGT